MKVLSKNLIYENYLHEVCFLLFKMYLLTGRPGGPCMVIIKQLDLHLKAMRLGECLKNIIICGILSFSYKSKLTIKSSVFFSFNKIKDDWR